MRKHEIEQYSKYKQTTDKNINPSKINTMSFTPISIDGYIKVHLKNNPDEKEVNLRESLQVALADYKAGIKCFCGNDIWVVGSASVGNACYTCITGNSQPDDDYEIELAIVRRINAPRRRHIDDIPRDKIAGFFDDDGYEVSPTSVVKAPLCIICQRDYDRDYMISCMMTRLDQENEATFTCPDYLKIN